MQRRSLLVAVALAALACGPLACGQLKRAAYDGFGRDEWQQPERVIESLALEPGQHIADVGAGGGYFTFRLAEAVGADGRVYAVDVDPDMTEHLAERSAEEGAGNVEVVLAEYGDPLIPEPGVDLLFTCNTYHHIEGRVDYFANARKYLRPGGRVAIIELQDEGWFQRFFPHHTPAETITEELEAAGYEPLERFDYLERQHFLVFGLRD